MTTAEREKIAARIKALLAKTTENGCTEGEAIAAIAKAHELMQEHQINMGEAELLAEGFADELRDWQGKKHNRVRWWLGRAIAGFTSTKIFAQKTGAKERGRFVGFRSDVDFAMWLEDSLTAYVIRAADAFALQVIKSTAERNRCNAATAKRLIGAKRLNKIWDDFAIGVTMRISERMEEAKKAASVQVSNGRGLVTLDKALIVDRMLRELGIHLRTEARNRRMDAGAYNAGRSAGDRAGFGRPVNGNGAALMIRKR